MKRFGLIAGLALILIANVYVLAGVAYNRSGDAAAALELTERELRIQRMKKENTGLFLRLMWNGNDYYGPAPAEAGAG